MGTPPNLALYLTSLSSTCSEADPETFITDFVPLTGVLETLIPVILTLLAPFIKNSLLFL
jgi:hypothetical protein